MTFLWAIILAVLQGITLFLPISSAGSVGMVGNLLPFEMQGQLLFPIFLYIGSSIAIIRIQRTSVSLFIKDTIGIFLDGIYNLRTLILHKEDEKNQVRRIIANQHRKFNSMIWMSLLPCLIVGFSAESLAVNALKNVAVIGIGFCLTAVFLFVGYFVKSGEAKPSDLTYTTALIIGIVMGIASVPGISSLGCVFVICLICGMNKKMAYEYTLLLTVLAVIASCFRQIGTGFWSEISLPTWGAYILAMIVSFYVSTIMYQRCRRLMFTKGLTFFAIISGVIGIASLVYQFKLA